MKQLLIILFMLGFSISSYSQYPKVYGHNTYDAIGRALASANDGGVLIGGAERLTLNGNLTGYLRKTDINGNELWKRYFAQDNGATVIVAGISINSNDEILVSGTSNGQWDGFLVKLNSCGEKQWCRVIEIPSQNLCMNNVVFSDNSYIIQSDHNQFSYDRIWLYHVSSEGEMLWMKCMEPDTNYFDETGYYLLLTNDSCVLVTGFNFFIREPGSGLGWFSPLWVKFDLEGNQLWDLTWYGDDFIHGNFGHTIQDAYGNYYGAGADGFQEPDMKASFYKFTPDGIPLKLVHVFDQGAASGAYSISFFEDSTLFIGGAYAYGNNGYSMVIKSDTAGNVIKTKDVPLYGNPVGYSVVTHDKKVLALGERYPEYLGHWETCLFKFNQELEYDSIYTQPYVYDSLCPHPVSPVETILLDCEIVDVEEPMRKPENSRLTFYPVPSSGQVTVTLPEYYITEETHFRIKTTTTYFQLKGDKTIEIYDLHGKKTASFLLHDGETSLTFDVSAWAPGIYMARLVCKGKVWAQGKLMVVR